MKDYIINSFILQDINSLLDIYNYIKWRYMMSVNITQIKQNILNLIKNNILFLYNNKYELSKEGKVILNDHKYYYSKIIITFYSFTFFTHYE